VAETRNLGSEWSVAYAVSIKRLDSQFMLCLLRLVSWPNLGNMHGDLVDDLRLICALLAKRPMVGFLVARRLKLSVDKTFALLSVLESRGHVHAMGSNSIDVDLDAIDFDTRVNSNSATLSEVIALEPIPTSTSTSSIPKAVQTSVQTLLQASTTQSQKPLKTSVKTQTQAVVAKQEDSGDVLNQLWRVLNTDIVMSKAARANIDPKVPVGKEAGDVLSQLWYVLNTDIGGKRDTVNKPVVKTTTKSGKSNKASTANTANKVNKPNTTSTPNTFSDSAIRDVNGNIIAPDKVKDDQAKENEAKDVMGQLWSVLNTDIAFKRQSGNETANEPSAAKAKEVAEVMAQLWRVLNTEIASKRQSNTKGGAESLSDTTREANDKLSKLWRILDAEIVLKKKPSTYLMTDDPVESVKKEVEDTSGEAVARLSQLWQVLNSEIAIALPPEKRSAAKRR
jgi:hypothetical protein